MVWKKGESGNPRGRQPGVEKVRQLLDPHREALVAKAVELALSGDVQALRLCLERISPPPRTETAPVRIPGMTKAATMSDKARCIVDAVGDGVLSADAGSAFLAALANAQRVIEVDELEARIAALEERPQP